MREFAPALITACISLVMVLGIEWSGFPDHTGDQRQEAVSRMVVWALLLVVLLVALITNGTVPDPN